MRLTFDDHCQLWCSRVWTSFSESQFLCRQATKEARRLVATRPPLSWLTQKIEFLLDSWSDQFDSATSNSHDQLLLLISCPDSIQFEILERSSVLCAVISQLLRVTKPLSCNYFLNLLRDIHSFSFLTFLRAAWSCHNLSFILDLFRVSLGDLISFRAAKSLKTKF